METLNNSLLSPSSMLLSIHVFKGINTSPYPRRQTRLRKPNANDKAIATAKMPYSLRILLSLSLSM